MENGKKEAEVGLTDCEESCGVIHKCVEATELRDSHDEAGSENCTASGGSGEDELGGLPERGLCHGGCGFVDGYFNGLDLGFTLFWCRGTVDA